MSPEAANPYAEVDELRKLQTPLIKVPAPTEGQIAATVGHFLSVAQRRTGYRLDPDHQVLDFGCGIGDSVGYLMKRCSAYGVDVIELWGRDFDQYWCEGDRPDQAIVERLRHIDLTKTYRIPFEDNTFDFAFSDQVFEHVADYAAAFRELRRVLKPGATSVHRFPGPNSPFEGHIMVPIVPLCRYRPWLAFWAMAGRRSVRQVGMSWQDVVDNNVEMLKFTNYPTKAQIRRYARAAGVAIEFYDVEGVDKTVFRRLYKKMNPHNPLVKVLARLFSLTANRTMIVRKPA